MTTCFDPYANVKDGKYREGLFRQSIDSINRVDWRGHKPVLILSDDASARMPSFTVRIPAWVTRNRTRLGAQRNNRANILHSCYNARWTLVFDSDAVVRPDFVDFWREHYNRNDIAGINLFNSRFHNRHAIVQDKLVLKETVQGCGALFRSGDFIPTDHDGAAWEDSLAYMGVLQGKRWLVPSRSLMNHLGDYGLSNNGEMNDRDPGF